MAHLPACGERQPNPALVDGAPLLEKADNRYLDGGKVGMFSVGAQISVRSFKVLRL